MKQGYDDILSLTSSEPTWWTAGGVPRWCDYAPEDNDNIYTREAALLLIRCQCCGHLFQAAITSTGRQGEPDIAAQIADGTVHYGDPPNIGCCLTGPTMTSETLRVLRYHRFGPPIDQTEAQPGLPAWHRDPRLEIGFATVDGKIGTGDESQHP